MCGFAGEMLYSTTGTSRADLELAVRMASKLRHRGPDETGRYASGDGRCAIGFQRLAVIDRSGSHQPMTSEDGQFCLAFNGEIYNYRDLRSDLQHEGELFASQGDTEVLLKACLRWGVRQALSRLEGMFAFVLYDEVSHTLHLVRDRLGQKPLWYAPLPDRLLFASEAKALLAHPALGATPMHTSVYAYLTMGYIPAPASAWRDIRKLMPATHAAVTGGEWSEDRYWTISPEVSTEQVDTDAILLQRLERAVRLRMNADVPVGTLLSGGLDSGIITALACEAAGDPASVRTFSARLDDPEYDESALAAQTAATLGTSHQTLDIAAPSATDFETVVDAFDEPFGDSSALPTWQVCRASRREVTVALTGDGGDEVFGGYDRYRAMHLAETMGPGKYMLTKIAAALLDPFAPSRERSRLRRFVRFAEGLGAPFAAQYLQYRSICRPGLLEQLLQPHFLSAAESDVGDWFVNLYESCEWQDEVTMAQHHDMSTYLPDDLLVKADIASMASSLELRSPLLDHHLVALGLGLPLGEKLSRGAGKAMLRRLFAGRLPKSVLKGPKRGFGVPLRRWLGSRFGELARDLLLGNQPLRVVAREDACKALLQRQEAGQADYSHPIWLLMVLSRWLSRNPL